MQAAIDCVLKAYECYETDPVVLEDIKIDGLRLLTLQELKQYRNLVPGDDGLPEDWKNVMTCKEKRVTLVVGYHTDEDFREMANEENFYDSSALNQTTQNFVLAYHQVRTHALWPVSKPQEGGHYQRFQVSTCVLHCSYAMCIPDFILDMHLWYNQQVEEGKAPGHPLGFGRYGNLGPQDAAVEGERDIPLYSDELEPD